MDPTSMIAWRPVRTNEGTGISIEEVMYYRQTGRVPSTSSRELANSLVASVSDGFLTKSDDDTLLQQASSFAPVVSSDSYLRTRDRPSLLAN